MQPQPQESAPGRSPWMAIGIVLVVLGVAAIAFLIWGGGTSPTPPPGGMPSPSLSPTPPVSGQLDQEIIREIGEVNAGRTIADIDQDIQATNLSAIDQELEALDQEMRGL